MDYHTSSSIAKKKLEPRVFTLPLVVGLACGALVLTAQVAFFSSLDGHILNVIEVIAFITCGSIVISSVVLFIASVPLLLFKKMRLLAFQWMISCVLVTVPSVLSTLPREWLRINDFQRIERNAEPLIQAIKKYTNENNKPPEKLEVLVPTYIEKIPATGNGRCADYSYGVKNKSWELCVYLGIFFMGTRDCLVYWPSENYPDKVSRGKVERVGKWAYFPQSNEPSIADN